MLYSMERSYKSNTRSKTVSILLICILVLSFTSLLGAAFAQQTGQIDVAVQGYDGSSVMTASLLDAKGRYLENKTVNAASFSFTNVSLTQPNSIILTYQGVPYTTNVNVTKDSRRQVNVTVYELATSDANVTISFHHIALNKGDGSISVTEYIEFVNFGDKVQNGTDLKVYMPQGFKNLQSSHSCCMTKTDFGFFFKIPEPVLPGGTLALDLSYEISPDTDQYKFEERTYYDTGFVILTVPTDADLKVVPNSNESIRSEGSVEIEKQTFDAYSADYVFAGQGFALTVTGYKAASINVVWAGTGILFAIIFGAVVYGFRGTKISADKLQTESEALTSVMAELETDFIEGKVTEVEYLKLKLKYKTRLELVQSKLQEAARAKVK